MQEFAEKYHKEFEGVAPAAQQLLMSYSWPGNVRQLRTAVENMVTLSLGKSSAPKRCLRKSSRRAAAEHLGGMDNLVGISIEQRKRN